MNTFVAHEGEEQEFRAEYLQNAALEPFSVEPDALKDILQSLLKEKVKAKCETFCNGDTFKGLQVNCHSRC